MTVIIDNTTNNDIEHMASEYCKAKEAIKKLEAEVEAYKQVLIAAAKENGGAITFGEYEIKSTQKSRENFSLAKARVVIDAAILAPFISTSKFDDLRVKRLTDGDSDE